MTGASTACWVHIHKSRLASMDIQGIVTTIVLLLMRFLFLSCSGI